MSAAQALCAHMGYEVVETLVIIELIGLGGRERLENTDHLKTFLRFSEADLEAIAAQYADRVHQPKDS